MNWVAGSDAVTTATAISADNEDEPAAKIQTVNKGENSFVPLTLPRRPLICI